MARIAKIDAVEIIHHFFTLLDGESIEDLVIKFGMEFETAKKMFDMYDKYSVKYHQSLKEKLPTVIE